MGKVAIGINKSTSQDSASEGSLSLSESSIEIQRILLSLSLILANQLALTQETAKPFLDN